MLNYKLHKIFLVLLCNLFVCSPTCAVVTVTEDSSTVRLDNGIVSATFSKSTSRMTSLTKGAGPNLLAGGKVYFDADTNAGHAELNSGEALVYALIANTGDYAEISFSQTYTDRLPFVVDLHYILKKGESGLHWFATYETDGQSAKWLAQNRLVIRCDPAIFTHLRLTDDRYEEMATPAEVSAGIQLVPGEATQIADGSINYKYLTHSKEDETPVYGLYGTSGGDYWGLWMITPDSESISGGHLKQNLAVHQTTSTPVILRMLQAGHYGGAKQYFSENESWSKFYGPFFIYVNSASDSEALWADAKAKCAAEQAKWPYEWVDHPLYPIQRATVTGTLDIKDGSSPDGAWIGLAPPGTYWAQEGKGYQFWTQAQADGSFTIEHVRPGTYMLYAHVDGVMDEYVLNDVVVPASGTVNLGTLNWQPVRYGEIIWQVGIANRSVSEFKHGDDLGHWGLWLEYPTDFPTDVNFVVGQSDPREDWNYAHCAVGWTEPYTDAQPEDFHIPDWNILFDMASVSEGTAFLSIDIVSCDLAGKYLTVLVNGTEVANLDGSLLGPGGAMRRCSYYGYISYKKQVVEFDTSLLQAGTNTVTFRFHGSYFNAVMYDCVRLEIRSKSDNNGDSQGLSGPKRRFDELRK